MIGKTEKCGNYCIDAWQTVSDGEKRVFLTHGQPCRYAFTCNAECTSSQAVMNKMSVF
jgi:hypothetical protein